MFDLRHAQIKIQHARNIFSIPSRDPAWQIYLWYAIQHARYIWHTPEESQNAGYISGILRQISTMLDISSAYSGRDPYARYITGILWQRSSMFDISSACSDKDPTCYIYLQHTRQRSSMLDISLAYSVRDSACWIHPRHTQLEVFYGNIKLMLKKNYFSYKKPI